MSKAKAKVLFLSHGGGPLPLLGDPSHREMVSTLQQIAKELDRPAAILVISAHWEAATASITAGSQPELIYDYYGFPDESYDIQYPCPGEPALATQVQAVLARHDIKASLESYRGFDHGLFVPLKIMYPQADIPCIQLSLLASLDPTAHIRLGMALADLEFENLLIVGSGFSFHNLKAFFTPANEQAQIGNTAFEDWLIETCSSHDLSEAQRTQRLEHWFDAPHARYCHPREEHLLPLLVCYGVAQAACRQYYRLHILNKQASMYLW
ncbi:MAG: class III extradiol ring-cleavage dioxygenase [Gammaproteobacteria bacterium]